MSLTRQQEIEIYPILDAVSELAPGKAVLYECEPGRASYLSRIIQGLRFDSAMESIQMYPPSDPLYGQGLYSLILAEPHLRGLLVTKLSSPLSSARWTLIQVAAFHQPLALENIRTSTAFQYLNRMQRKYPDIMGKVWISPGPPIVARWAEVEKEELLIVDIDINPSAPLSPPTKEQKAKARGR